MSKCVSELLRAYRVSNPTTANTLLVLQTADLSLDFRVITVFNETDQDIQVDYKTEGGYDAAFIVPKGGRSFTRVINGKLNTNSLYYHALDNAATGKVIINLGN